MAAWRRRCACGGHHAYRSTKRDQGRGAARRAHPAGVRELVAHEHTVSVQTGAGLGIGAPDEAYKAAGAAIVATAAEVWAEADMIVKVKEPQSESGHCCLRADPLHVSAPRPRCAPDRGTARQRSHLHRLRDGDRPQRRPAAAGADVPLRAGYPGPAGPLSRGANGGAGLLLAGGVPGVLSALTVVIGGGVVGENAIEMAVGLGSQVAVLDRNLDVLDRLSRRFGAALETVYSTRQALEDLVTNADLVIGAVLLKGATAPKLVSEAMVKSMKPGSVLVDVPSIRGAASRRVDRRRMRNPLWCTTSCTTALPTCQALCRARPPTLNNATMPYTLASQTMARLMPSWPTLISSAGSTSAQRMPTEAHVAEAQGRAFVDPADALTKVYG